MAEMARGVVFVHSSPAALCPHVEWAMGAVLGEPVHLDWNAQPAEYGSWHAEYRWRGTVGASAALTSALRACRRVRFEVTEHNSTSSIGQRYAFTPALGVFHALTSEHGDIVIGEQRIRAAMMAADGGDESESLADAIRALLGERWDDELEVFRHAGEGAPVRWLHRVG